MICPKCKIKRGVQIKTKVIDTRATGWSRFRKRACPYCGWSTVTSESIASDAAAIEKEFLTAVNASN